jgi:hypothetical protein
MLHQKVTGNFRTIIYGSSPGTNTNLAQAAHAQFGTSGEMNGHVATPTRTMEIVK